MKTRKLRIGVRNAASEAAHKAALEAQASFDQLVTPVDERAAAYLLGLGDAVDARMRELALTEPERHARILASERFHAIAGNPRLDLRELAELSIMLGLEELRLADLPDTRPSSVNVLADLA